MRWITTKVLLCSTGKSTQYCVMACMGKESSKERIWCSVIKNHCHAGDAVFDQEDGRWVRKVPLRKKWQLTPVFLPGKSHGQRSLADYSPWGHKSIRCNLETKRQQCVCIT